MAVGQVELALRVAAGLFVIVAPTVLFLGLWHGLEAMRDDELVQRAKQRAETMDTDGGAWNVDSASVRAAATRADPVPDETVACDNCGTYNCEDVTYCRDCLSDISG
ncbi:zinc ribbon domain-containing protein [Haloarcula montana]|uniref:zinc ribbon domain-containing protein n=1 Tax=Haloarcula montana TaxID=3111776 RepID=UPI002D77B632|nr:zinc ribbon domain-containing protein [Haloarcula sp. GH36]